MVTKEATSKQLSHDDHCNRLIFRSTSLEVNEAASFSYLQTRLSSQTRKLNQPMDQKNILQQQINNNIPR